MGPLFVSSGFDTIGAMPATPRHPVVRRGLGALVAGLVLATAALVLAPARAEAVTNPPVTITATSPSTSSLKLTWSAPVGVGSQGWSIHLKDSAGRTWPATTACTACRSTVINGLLAGTRYDVTIVGYGTTPVGVGTTVGTVQAGTCAGVTNTCVSVGSTAVGAVSHVGQGFLHGTTAATDTSKVAALDPQAWRIASGDFARFTRARQLGGDITLLMSDPWRGWADRNGLAGQNPWADWAKYSEFIAGSVRYHVAAGMVPEYWEVQNEPDWAANYTDAVPATWALVLEQFKVAHDAIRSVIPDARIVGPSLTNYRLASPTAVIDLISFLDHAKANGLRFDIAWHELGNGQPATLSGDPHAVIAHVDSVRAAIADRGLTDVQIHINEYGAAWSFDQPGVHVGYIAALETAGVHIANTACWPVVHLGISYGTCFADPGLLDGLLSPLGLETDTYAVHKAYAAMNGQRTQTATNDAWTSATAARDAGGVVRGLVGRHQSCTVGLDGGCHAGIAPAPVGKTVTLAMTVSCRTKYDLRVQLISNVHNGLPSIPVTVVAKAASCGSTKVTLPALTDGSAYSFTASPR
jgi:hypothetical protein